MNPSLALIPCAFDTGKLYSVLPSDGLGDFTVSRNGTATYLGADGLLKTAQPNEPRLEFNTDGTFKGVLVEPAGTNLVLRSEEFENATWIKLNTTISQNTAISPSGILNADSFIGNDYGAFKLLTQSGIATSGIQYSHSVYVKKNTNDFFQIFGPSSVYTSATVFANFDLNNGVLGSVGEGTTASITNVGNGWYRCTMTATATATVASQSITGFGLITSATSIRAEYNTLSTSVFIWGAQIEVGSVATSYIPTVASTVTRPADAISKTEIADLIGQTEGTVFVELNLQKSFSRTAYAIVIRNNISTLNALRIYISLSGSINNNIAFQHVVNNVTTSVISNITTNNIAKIGVAYKNGQVTTMAINGNLYSTSGAIGAFTDSINQIVIGSFSVSAFLPLNDCVKSATIFKTRLSNAQLQALTTL